MNYAQVLKDIASVCQTLRAFIRESLSTLESLSPNQYIAALNGFLFPEFRHKWIANPIEGTGNYTLFDDVRIHLVPRETAPDSGQFRVFECTRVKSSLEAMMVHLSAKKPMCLRSRTQ